MPRHGFCSLCLSFSSVFISSAFLSTRKSVCCCSARQSVRPFVFRPSVRSLSVRRAVWRWPRPPVSAVFPPPSTAVSDGSESGRRAPVGRSGGRTRQGPARGRAPAVYTASSAPGQCRRRRHGARGLSGTGRGRETSAAARTEKGNRRWPIVSGTNRPEISSI